MTRPWRVVVADDHPVSRSGLVFLLSAEADLEVVGEAADGAAALVLVEQQQPDLLILDVMLPGMTGIVVLERLQTLANAPRVLVISGSVAGMAFRQALDLGADGLVSKEEEAEVLLAAIAGIRRNEIPISPVVRELIGPLPGAEGPGADGDEALGKQLTQREREILVLVAQGRSNREIGELLHISPGTAKKHREHIREKLDFRSVSDATRIAARLGLIKLT